MVFKSIEEFEAHVLAKCSNAVAKTQEISRQDIIKQADAFYGDYDPVMYDRTGQLSSEKFIQKSPVILSGSGCEASVYLDASSLNYTTGRQPSGEQVVSAAVGGGHGATGLRVMSGKSGVSLWDDQLQEKANSDLVQALRAQGIPLV